MAAQSKDDDGNRRAERLLMEIRDEVILVRSQYLAERGSGQVHPQTIEALREVTISYYEALREHREETVVEEKWQESGVQRLENLLEETTVVERDRPGHGTAADLVDVPLIQEVNPQVLVDLTRKMDDLCKDLGFSASVNESTPRTKIDDELVEEVEKWRQKNIE